MRGASAASCSCSYLVWQQPNQDQELSRRDGASHLSLLVQRNLAQRKHTPPPRPMLCIGFAEPAGFSEGASCPRGKRRTSMCGALRVLSAGSVATEGPREGKSRSKVKSTIKCKHCNADSCTNLAFLAAAHGCFPSSSRRVRTGGAA